MAGRKLGDATFYVARRLGRVLATEGLVPESCPRVAILLDGSLGSALLLTLMVKRRLWVPHRPELLALVTRPGPAAFQTLPGALGLELLEVPQAPLQTQAELAAQAGAGALLLGDCLEDRAAEVFCSLLLDGALKSRPLAQRLGGLPLGRPLGVILHQRLQEAGQELGLDPGFDDSPDRLANPRLALLEEFLALLPGSRLDLLTNLAASPDRIRDGYLT